MNELANQFVSSINDIVDSKLEGFTPSAGSAFALSEDIPVSRTVSTAPNVIEFELGATKDELSQYQNKSLKFNLHLKFADGSEIDTTISSPQKDIRSLTVDDELPIDVSYVPNSYPNPPRIEISLRQDYPHTFSEDFVGDCTLEFVPQSLKTTINGKEYAVALPSYYDEAFDYFQQALSELSMTVVNSGPRVVNCNRIVINKCEVDSANNVIKIYYAATSFSGLTAPVRIAVHLIYGGGWESVDFTVSGTADDLRIESGDGSSLTASVSQDNDGDYIEITVGDTYRNFTSASAYLINFDDIQDGDSHFYIPALREMTDIYGHIAALEARIAHLEKLNGVTSE